MVNEVRFGTSLNQVIFHKCEDMNDFKNRLIKSTYWLISRIAWLMIWLVSGVILYLTSLGLMNYHGYCFKEKRFLSDRERIQRVVADVVEHKMPFWPVRKNGNGVTLYWVIDGSPDPIEPIFYKNIEEFSAENPNCCEFVPYMSGSEGRWRPDFLNRVIADCSGGIIRVTYKARFRNKVGETKFLDTSWETTRNNCGASIPTPF